MSDIKKLHKVIGDLEEQASKVSEFNGVLREINSAKVEIASSKTAFDELVQEQKKLITESNTRFTVYGNKLEVLEEKITVLESNQQRTLSMLAELEILTPVQFEQGISSTLKSITDQFIVGNTKIENLVGAQTQALSSLRAFVWFVFIVLASGIAFL